MNVVRHVSRWLDGCRSSCPVGLLNDFDLIMLIDRVLELRERDTVRVTEVKSQVKELDKFCTDLAEEAADFGRRRVDPVIIDARRVCRCWCPIILDLHRFFIAISRAVVNHDNREGTAPDPLVWSACALPKRRRLVDAVRNHAVLPGPAVIWTSDWVSVPPVVIAADDVCAWPYCVGIQVKWDAFLNTLHWSASGAGVGSLMLNCFYCMSFGQERGWCLKKLCLDIAGHIARFQCRLFLLVWALIVGDHVGSLGLSCGHCVPCLVVLADLFLA